MKARVIAAVELRRWLRDRSNIFFVFVLPVGIIVLVGSLYGGGVVPVVGTVASGELGHQFVGALAAEGSLEVVDLDDLDELVRGVERGTLQAGVVLPEDYDESLLAGLPVQVGFVARPDGAGGLLEARVRAVAAEQATVMRAAAFAAGRGAASDLVGVAQEAAAAIPAIEVTATVAGESLFPATGSSFDLGAPSQLILFMFLTGLTGSVTLIGTRRLGVAGRMLSTPTSSRTIILGELLARLAISLVQGIYIVAVSAAFFGVHWGDPVAAVAIVLLFGAVSAGTATLMGAAFATEQQAGAIGVSAGIGIAALGGCMIPLEFYSSTMQRVARVTPHAWAIDAFAEIIRRHGSLADVVPHLAVLAAFAVGLVAVGSIRLRSVLTR